MAVCRPLRLVKPMFLLEEPCLESELKTLQAFYSDDLGKKFSIVPMITKAIDMEIKIRQVNILSILEDGYYAMFFRRANNGNFQLTSTGLTHKPMVFQVVNKVE